MKTYSKRVIVKPFFQKSQQKSDLLEYVFHQSFSGPKYAIYSKQDTSTTLSEKPVTEDLKMQNQIIYKKKK